MPASVAGVAGRRNRQPPARLAPPALSA